MRESRPIAIVFLYNFFIFLLFVSFFSSLSMQYHCMVTQEAKIYIFGLHFAKAACFAVPIAITGAAISIYVFLLRHHEALFKQISIFILCLMTAIFLIIPLFYLPLTWIDQTLNAFNLQDTSDKGLIRFLSIPSEIGTLTTEITMVLKHLYASYCSSYVTYIVSAGAFFLLLGALFSLSIFAQWNMLNFAFLILLLRFSLFLYPYTQKPLFIQILHTVHLKNDSIGIAIVTAIGAALLYSISIAIILKHRAAKKKGNQ